MGKASAFTYLFLAAPLALAACNQPAANSTAPTDATTTATTTTTTATPATIQPLPANATDDQIVQSAMAAAPASIAKDASVITIGADGTMREVRKGTNGFTCLADNPQTPGPDPMCGDANAMEWAQAWMAKKTPPPGKVGFMYMLAGGVDASNTDPHAMAPTTENNWVRTGPHVMVVGAKDMMGGYPRTQPPDTSKPYVMFPDTQYEHLMLPVG